MGRSFELLTIPIGGMNRIRTRPIGVKEQGEKGEMRKEAGHL
jgi:hypothetical protein